jgi:hypothetical protein
MALITIVNNKTTDHASIFVVNNEVSKLILTPTTVSVTAKNFRVFPIIRIDIVHGLELLSCVSTDGGCGGSLCPKTDILHLRSSWSNMLCSVIRYCQRTAAALVHDSVEISFRIPLKRDLLIRLM